MFNMSFRLVSVSMIHMPIHEFPREVTGEMLMGYTYRCSEE